MGSGGEGGIRTPGTGFSPYNGLANRRIQPLCHLSGDHFQLSTVFAFARYFWRALSATRARRPTQNRSETNPAKRVANFFLPSSHS